MNTRQKVQIFGAVVLMLCLLPLPYGFYTLARLVTTIISVYLAYCYFDRNKKQLSITFFVIALVFQPFFKLGLGRDIWTIVDIAVAILLLILAMRKK